MTGWFDITGLDAKAPEDKAGFEESKTRIERVRLHMFIVAANKGHVG